MSRGAAKALQNERRARGRAKLWYVQLVGLVGAARNAPTPPYGYWSRKEHSDLWMYAVHALLEWVLG